MGEKLDVAAEMRRSADAMAEHAASLRAEGDDDQAEAVAVIAAGNLEIAKAVEAKDRRIATLEAERDEAIALLRVCDAYLAWTDGKRLTELKTDVQAFLARYDEPSDGGAGS